MKFSLGFIILTEGRNAKQGFSPTSPQQEFADWSLAARECGRLNQLATPLLGFSVHERMKGWILSRQLGLTIHSSHFDSVCVCITED